MSQVARQHFSFRQYVRLEEYSNVRHEFLDGIIYAMPGGTPRHAALAARVIGELGARLARTDCEVFTSDLRVRVPATGLATYPDVTVVCGPLVSDPEDRSTIVNPAVVVEVSSDSTEDYDRGEKLDHYRRIAALREILLVSHREPRVEIWRHDEGGTWSEAIVGRGELVDLQAVGCTIPVDELYRELPPESESETR